MEPLNELTVEHLERAADLPLEPDRRALVASQFRALVEAANELSRKMAAPRHRGLTPAVRFGHPEVDEEAPL